MNSSCVNVSSFISFIGSDAELEDLDDLMSYVFDSKTDGITRALEKKAKSHDSMSISIFQSLLVQLFHFSMYQILDITQIILLILQCRSEPLTSVPIPVVEFVIQALLLQHNGASLNKTLPNAFMELYEACKSFFNESVINPISEEILAAVILGNDPENTFTLSEKWKNFEPIIGILRSKAELKANSEGKSCCVIL
ncbi:hypothetical protein RCL1_007352 [Eukaryota sp. TZLM3-RCL]